MKILLVAINAKYIHSNLAVYSLKSYAEQALNRESDTPGTAPVQEQDIPQIELAEYTINQTLDDILMDLYKRKPDFVAFSVYIWNLNYVEELVREVRKLFPTIPIWLGGPEVSYDSVEVLDRLPEVSGVMMGEGEETFTEMLEGKPLSEICGITYRAPYVTDEELDQMNCMNGSAGQKSGRIIRNQWRDVLDLSKVPFVYDDMADFAHKIIYYESSRGCPFSCSYCLSSVDKRLRFRDIELVKKELQFFLDHQVPQVKFVDRTFNCKHEHSMAIWSYIKEHDNGVTNFHFEVAADLMNEEELELISTMRTGLIQLEIGVQSTNPATIDEIHRVMDFEHVKAIVRKVQSFENTHQHLDLIAGLPYEDLDTFARSFNDVYAIRPEQLQLGFLKVLKGSYMYEHQKEYGLVYKSTAPYEVLYTKWLPYEDVLQLKRVEEMVEVYYNSGQFKSTIVELEKEFETPFQMYLELGRYYEAHELHLMKHSRVSRYEILHDFILEMCSDERIPRFREVLIRDLYLRENLKSRPAFIGDNPVDKQFVRKFYEREEEQHKMASEDHGFQAGNAVLEGYEAYDKKQMAKMTHVEFLDGHHVLFDYVNRNPLNHDARVIKID